jgi:hypothetical protein
MESALAQSLADAAGYEIGASGLIGGGVILGQGWKYGPNKDRIPLNTAQVRRK